MPTSPITQMLTRTFAPALTTLGWEAYSNREFRMRNAHGDEACINFQSTSLGRDCRAAFYVNIALVLRSLWEHGLERFGGEDFLDGRPDYFDIGHVLSTRLVRPSDATDTDLEQIWKIGFGGIAECVRTGEAVLARLDGEGWLDLLPRLLDRQFLLDAVLRNDRSIMGLQGGDWSAAALALLADDGPPELFERSYASVRTKLADFPAMAPIAKWARRRADSSGTS